MKKYWWISLVVSALIILIVIFARDFNKRYNALQDNLQYELTLTEKNNEYSFYNGDKDFIIRNDKLADLNNDTHIILTLQKTNNIFLYIEAGLNQNATVVWKNGILYVIKEINNE